MFGRVELNHLPQVPGWWCIDMATWYGPEAGLMTLTLSEQTQMESVVWSSYNAYCRCRLCVERGDIFWLCICIFMLLQVCMMFVFQMKTVQEGLVLNLSTAVFN